MNDSQPHANEDAVPEPKKEEKDEEKDLEPGAGSDIKPDRRAFMAGAAGAVMIGGGIGGVVPSKKRDESTPLRADPPPLIGVNVPFFAGWYGHDLGRNESYPNLPTADIGYHAPRLLDSLGNFGIRTVRIMLFEDGEGLVCDEDGRVRGLDETFLRNLDVLTKALGAAKFKVYWTLLDGDSVRRGVDYSTRALLTDADKAKSFADVALARVLPQLRDVTWGIDLLNEPEAAIVGQSGNLTSLGFRWWEFQRSLKVLRDSVREHMPGIAVSMGSGGHEHRNILHGVYERLGLDLDFYDFHLIQPGHDMVHTSSLPRPPRGPLAFALDRSPTSGELAVKKSRDPSVLAMADPRSQWQAKQEQLVAKLHTAMSRGFDAIFLWRASGDFQEDPEGLLFRSQPGRVLHSLPDLERRRLVRLAV